MKTFASTFFSLDADSAQAGRLAAEGLKRQFGDEDIDNGDLRHSVW